MKRLLANLALAAILSTFVLPLGVALEASPTPLCCLPGGKHHCTQKPTGPGFKSKTDTCPYAKKFLAISFSGFFFNEFEMAGPGVAGEICVAETSTDYRAAVRQISNRGPPELSF